MATDLRAIAHRWFEEVWNQGREETIDELLPADGIGHGLGEGTDTRGPEAFKIFWRNMRNALPDVRVRVEDTIVGADRVVLRVVLEGTHRGEGLGQPPTGRRVSVAGIVIIRFAGGRMAEAWNSWDQLGLLRQLGAAPSMPASDRFLSASE